RPPEQEAGAPRVDILRILATVGDALLVLGGPGLPAVLALRLRPLTASVALVPFSLLAIAVSAEVGHPCGIPWRIASPLAPGLPLHARTATAGVERAGGEGRDPTTAAAAAAAPATGVLSTPRGRALASLIGLVGGGANLLAPVLPTTGGLRAVNQSYDNVFLL